MATVFFLLFSLLFYNNCLSIDTENSCYSSDENNCIITCSNIGTTYNLCPLKLSKDGQIVSYEVHDDRYSDLYPYQFKYFFNIADKLSIYPDIYFNKPNNNICRNISNDIGRGYCYPENKTCDNDQLIPIIDKVWAYQVEYEPINNTEINCYRLSDINGGTGGPSYNLYNDFNPAEGIKLTYHNGDYCESIGGNRHFHFTLLCENGAYFVPEKEVLYEDEICHYIVETKSMYGCPVECEMYNEKVCGGNGLCGFDASNSKSKCFCYHTFDGDDCRESNNTDTAIISPKIHPNYTSPYVHTFNVDKHKVNVTYDLVDYKPHNKDDVFIIDDSDPENYKYDYYLGVLDSQYVPEICQNVSSGYAFQVDTISNSCYVLGTNYNWNLYDPTYDPAKGVILNYTGGTYCDTAGTNRSLLVSFICPDDIELSYDPKDEIEAYIEENSVCQYSLSIETAIGCPYQCKTDIASNPDLFTVCSQSGICAADQYAGFVRCLCDDGFQGAECRSIIPTTVSPSRYPTYKPTVDPTRLPTVSSTPDNASNAVYIILLIALVLLVIIGGVIIYKMKLKQKLLQNKLDMQYEQMDEENDVIDKDIEPVAMNQVDNNITDDADNTQNNELQTDD